MAYRNIILQKPAVLAGSVATERAEVARLRSEAGFLVAGPVSSDLCTPQFSQSSLLKSRVDPARAGGRVDRTDDGGR